MTRPPKKQPNVLDRLFNVAVSDKDVRQWLTYRAEELKARQLLFRASEGTARQSLVVDLTAWMHENAYTGRGTKKMVDKVVAQVMKDYRFALQVEDGAERVRGEWRKRLEAQRGKALANAFQQKNK